MILDDGAIVAGRVLNKALAPIGARRLQAALGRRRPVKLNIGCGAMRLPGWVNTDVTWRPSMYLDITRPWPIADDSVDAIYADNVIEHLTLVAARVVFREAHRVLKVGAVFRLATPDVERVARAYLENGELARAGIARNREKGRDLRYPVELLRTVFAEEGHHLGFCYDFESISTEMSEAGFTVERVEAGCSTWPDLVGLETRMALAEAATALIVEGTKD
jgi:predicted SAM-dependent methyltransferase